MFITTAILTLHRCTWPMQQHCIPPVLSLWMQSVKPYLVTGTKVIANKCILFGPTYEMFLVLYVMRNYVLQWRNIFLKVMYILSLVFCIKAKMKVKLFLCFNWASRQEGILGEWRYSSTHSSISALDGEWLTSRPSRFTSFVTYHVNTSWSKPSSLLHILPS